MMLSSLANLCATLIAATVFAALAPHAALAAGPCLDNPEVQAAMSADQIKSWPTIRAMAGISDQYKDLSAARVCEQNGQLYYFVNVAGPSGESKQLVLNAVDGSS